MSYIVVDSLEAKKSRPTQKTMKLEAHQFNGFAEVEGIYIHLRAPPNSDPGLGKTITALALAKHFVEDGTFINMCFRGKGRG